MLATIVLTIQVLPIILFAFTPASSGSPNSVTVEIRKGDRPGAIAKTLETSGVIKSASSFQTLGTITRKWPRIKAGEYEVSSTQTPLQIFAVLGSGVSVAHPITISEGLNMYQVADLLAQKGLAKKADFVSLCKDPKLIASLGFRPPLPRTLEGYLFPETYFFNRAMSATEMVKIMVGKFFATWTDRDEARAREMGLTRHELVTLASVVEKETGAPQERPLIASVFYNRLRKGMRLQSDPTTIYGIWETYKGNITREHLQQRTDYNTYAISALPAGPIANPGKAALQATLNPATSNYLFFVSKNDGTHQFSETLEQHTRAVRAFQMNPAARAGKSWRDLSKKTK
ncbi:MAG: endolytic transglycosylase MltG [Bacteriovoracia bacterium]